MWSGTAEWSAVDFPSFSISLLFGLKHLQTPFFVPLWPVICNRKGRRITFHIPSVIVMQLESFFFFLLPQTL